FFSMLPRPPSPTLFPYTTLFRSGLMGANLPGSVGSDPRIDHERLEPFYDRVEELGVPLFLHPTDAVFEELLEGYNGALHLSLGRDRKSTRLNSSHLVISYAVFCL